MTQCHYRTVPLGDLITAAFDRASLLSLDPKEVSRMATQSVAAMLGSGLRVSISHAPPWPHGLARLASQAAGAR